MTPLTLLTPSQPKPHQPLFVYLPGMDGSGYLLRSQLPHLAPHFDIRCLQLPPDDLRDWHSLAQETLDLLAPPASRSPPLPIWRILWRLFSPNDGQSAARLLRSPHPQ